MGLGELLLLLLVVLVVIKPKHFPALLRRALQCWQQLQKIVSQMHQAVDEQSKHLLYEENEKKARAHDLKKAEDVTSEL